MLTPLSHLTLGQTARVVRVDVRDEIGQRILEMGVTPGTLVRLTGAAPLGGPLVFEVRGYSLSLRKAEAERVEVDSGP